MYACIYIPGMGEEQTPALRACAEAFSPNIEFTPEAAILDIRGLRSLYGPPESIGKAIAQRVTHMGARVGDCLEPACRDGRRSRLPGTDCHSARRRRAGALIFIPRFPHTQSQMMRTKNFTPRSSSWGIETFADLAGLPENGIAERLGSAGVRLRRLARE